MSRIVDVASADNLLSQSAMCPTDWHFELVFKKAHINLRINVLATNCRTSADGLRMSVPQMVKQVRVQHIVKFVRRVKTEGNIPFVFLLRQILCLVLCLSLVREQKSLLCECKFSFWDNFSAIVLICTILLIWNGNKIPFS